MNNDLYTGTQAIRRAVALLKAFGPDSNALTPMELSQRADLNRSTVYRLLNALEHEGFVASDEAGRYRLGPEMAILGALALRQIDLRALAQPYMRTLVGQTGETVDLEVLHGGQTLIIDEMSGDHLVSAASNVGTLYPAHCASTGKALLAALAPEALDMALEGVLMARGPRSITEPDALREELALVRARGYATSYDELEAHLNAIGAAIFDHRGVAVAAISVSAPATRLPRKREAEIAALVVAASKAISAQLGFR